MVVAIAFLTVVTALITSTFIKAAQRERLASDDAAERDAHDLIEARFDELVQRLAAIEGALARIEHGAAGDPNEAPDARRRSDRPRPSGLDGHDPRRPHERVRDDGWGRACAEVVRASGLSAALTGPVRTSSTVATSPSTRRPDARRRRRHRQREPGTTLARTRGAVRRPTPSRRSRDPARWRLSDPDRRARWLPRGRRRRCPRCCSSTATRTPGRPNASTTGEAADMELGWLLGRGLDTLSEGVRAEIPRLAPERVAVLGPRDRSEIVAAGVEPLDEPRACRRRRGRRAGSGSGRRLCARADRAGRPAMVAPHRPGRPLDAGDACGGLPAARRPVLVGPARADGRCARSGRLHRRDGHDLQPGPRPGDRSIRPGRSRRSAWTLPTDSGPRPPPRPPEAVRRSGCA